MNHQDVRNHRDRQGPNDEGDGSDMFHTRSMADEGTPRHLALVPPKRPPPDRTILVGSPQAEAKAPRHTPAFMLAVASLTPHTRIGIEEGFRQVCGMPEKGASSFFTHSGSTDPKTSASSNSGNNSSGNNSSSNADDDIDVPVLDQESQEGDAADDNVTRHDCVAEDRATELQQNRESHEDEPLGIVFAPS